MQDILEKRSQKLHHLSIEWVGLAWNSSKLPSGILYILAIKNTNHQHQNACLYFLLTSFNAIYIYISPVWTANFPPKQNTAFLIQMMDFESFQPCETIWLQTKMEYQTSPPTRIQQFPIFSNSTPGPAAKSSRWMASCITFLKVGG